MMVLPGFLQRLSNFQLVILFQLLILTFVVAVVFTSTTLPDFLSKSLPDDIREVKKVSTRKSNSTEIFGKDGWVSFAPTSNAISDPELQYKIGLNYLHQGSPIDLSWAQKWMRKAAENKHPAAMHHLGVLLANAQNNTSAIPTRESHALIKEAAELGYALSQNYMGGVYRDGSIVEQDYKKAAEWYSKAAQQENMYGLFNLGLLYRDGKGVGRDKHRAVFLLAKAADMGIEEARYPLAHLLRWGGDQLEDEIGVAVSIFKELAEGGHVAAQFQYALSLAHGVGVDLDQKQAVKWYLKAADHGNADAMDNLSVMYSQGRGVELSPVKAYEWAQKAASLGHLGAQAKVAIFTYTGTGTEKNTELGVVWMLMVAQLGHKDTQKSLKAVYGKDYEGYLSPWQPRVDALINIYAPSTNNGVH
jgi:uncharacterized protein